MFRHFIFNIYGTETFLSFHLWRKRNKGDSSIFRAHCLLKCFNWNTLCILFPPCVSWINAAAMYAIFAWSAFSTRVGSSWTLTNARAMFVPAAACSLGDGEVGSVGLTQFHLPTSSSVLLFSSAPRRNARGGSRYRSYDRLARDTRVYLLVLVSSSARNNKRVHPPLTG